MTPAVPHNHRAHPRDRDDHLRGAARCMKVVISTGGRAHLFALARELAAHGHLRKIYSGYTRSRLARERIDGALLSTFPFVRPFLMASRYLPLALPASTADALLNLSVVTQDRYVARIMPDCDIFVGHEAVGLLSGRAAQRRGALYVCDRGCTHIGWRHRLLAAEYERAGLRPPPAPRTLERELAEYDAADLIVVPSRFAARSFVKEGFDESRLAVVPYGSDLRTFYPDGAPPSDVFVVLFVGQLCVRKGAFDLFAAFRRLHHPRKKLRIVGTIEPQLRARLASELARDDVELLGHLPPERLRLAMSTSHVLVLPSVEEGLALVQAEALACGCPVIATTNTGAEDLFDSGREGFIVPPRDPGAIAEYLQRLADDPDERDRLSANAVERMRQRGGWASYGSQMIAVYRRLIASRDAPSGKMM